jgi:hypothetical protein
MQARNVAFLIAAAEIPCQSVFATFPGNHEVIVVAA